MLILDRRVGERLMIGDDIVIVVLSVRDGMARIGINAPKHVAVYREDIYRRIQAGRASLPRPGQAAEGPATSVRRRTRGPAAPLKGE